VDKNEKPFHIKVTFVVSSSKLNLHHETRVFPDLCIRQPATLYRTHLKTAEQQTVVYRTRTKDTVAVRISGERYLGRSARLSACVHLQTRKTSELILK